jgi:hypothetical protein
MKLKIFIFSVITLLFSACGDVGGGSSTNDDFNDGYFDFGSSSGSDSADISMSSDGTLHIYWKKESGGYSELVITDKRVIEDRDDDTTRIASHNFTSTFNIVCYPSTAGTYGGIPAIEYSCIGDREFSFRVMTDRDYYFQQGYGASGTSYKGVIYTVDTSDIPL